MALPLYLAMTASEMSSINSFPPHFAYMACHFSPYGQGLSNLPTSLPPNAVLILNDNFPCQSHSPGLVADQLNHVIDSFHCENLLLDFQRPPCPESEQLINTLVSSTTVPVAISQGHSRNWKGAVFLPPCPLHVSLEEYLQPWQGQEIWLEAALCQENIVITPQGTVHIPQFPAQGLDGGFFDDDLCCQYRIHTDEESITFTLFDTPGSLTNKFSQAEKLGVSRIVGLWQELGYPL